MVILFTGGILWNGEDGRQIIVARKAQLGFLPGRKPNMVQKKNSDKKRTVTQMTRSQTEFIPSERSGNFLLSPATAKITQ